MKIELTEKEIKLLMSILEEADDNRADMGCNDPYPNEQKLFTKEERKEITKKYLEDPEERSGNGFMFNTDYVTYIIERIKEQIKK